jgi:hypothetical protein
MIWKWLLHNWLGVITAIGVLYGIVMSTYNFIVNRKTKQRRLTVTITRGFKPDEPGNISIHPLLFINVSNPGYRTVTINAPYFELPYGQKLEFPHPLADVDFPYELQECKSCRLWAKETDVIQFFAISCGYSGEVHLRGAVLDATGRVYKSKKTFRLDLRDGK